MIERIDTICITVSNLKLSSDWYHNVLGFTVSFCGEGYQILHVGKGSVPLTIEEGDTSRHTNHSYPIFFTTNIRDAYQTISEKGIKVSELQNDGKNIYFEFYDLDNNKLQVCYYE
ncbi:VOC family protein [Bacillus weihaiensis]|uniref:VOC family protein n=1 Tax=Bacillus weihaiensis TaxID=1547283 RepID=UPI002356D6F0|nr:VOC family protein [Bacillus weihaiensis]